jgi:hypothetical protein
VQQLDSLVGALGGGEHGDGGGVVHGASVHGTPRRRRMPGIRTDARNIGQGSPDLDRSGV